MSTTQTDTQIPSITLASISELVARLDALTAERTTAIADRLERRDIICAIRHRYPEAAAAYSSAIAEVCDRHDAGETPAPVDYISVLIAAIPNLTTAEHEHRGSVAWSCRSLTEAG